MSEPQPRLYLLDVEGTVAPLTLTSELLFPYARMHFPDFLKKNLGNAAVRADLSLLAEENRAEADAAAPRALCHLEPGPIRRGRWSEDEESAIRAAALEYLLWLMDRDRKSTALKSLQGKIWKAGFKSGELKGELFLDVPAAFARWAETGKVAIYSSGSVEAQKLLFGHTVFGDLAPLIAGYFDTRTGPKAESASYAAIATRFEIRPGAVLFFSDAVRELDAARAAGCQTRLVVRPGNAPVDDAHGHAAVESFALI